MVSSTISIIKFATSSVALGTNHGGMYYYFYLGCIVDVFIAATIFIIFRWLLITTVKALKPLFIPPQNLCK